jgi:hypothetical protein
LSPGAALSVRRPWESGPLLRATIIIGDSRRYIGYAVLYCTVLVLRLRPPPGWTWLDFWISGWTDGRTAEPFGEQSNEDEMIGRVWLLSEQANERTSTYSTSSTYSTVHRVQIYLSQAVSIEARGCGRKTEE